MRASSLRFDRVTPSVLILAAAWLLSTSSAGAADDTTLCGVSRAISIAAGQSPFAGKWLGDEHQVDYRDVAMCFAIAVENVGPDGSAKMTVFNGDQPAWHLTADAWETAGKTSGEALQFVTPNGAHMTATLEGDALHLKYHSVISGRNYEGFLKKMP